MTTPLLSFGAIRLALRRLSRAPGFALTVLAVFGLCLGANALVLSVIRGVLVNALPFHDPQSLVVLTNSYSKANVSHIGSSVPNYFERSQMTSFSGTASLRGANIVVGGIDAPQRTQEFRVTASFFPLLDVTPYLGRLFLTDDCNPGNDHIAVLGYDYWKEHYNGDAELVGRSILIDGTPTTVVGILPKSFRYPTRANASPVIISVWQPLTFSQQDRGLDRRHNNDLQMIARLKPGVSLRQAQKELDALNASLVGVDPFAKIVSDAGFHSDVVGLQAEYVAPVRSTLVLLEVGVVVLLLIGAANLLGLFTIRSSNRRGELSVQHSLGASVGQLLAIPVAEALVLAVGSWLVGLGIAYGGLKAFSYFSLDRLRLGATLSVDNFVVIITFAAAVVIGAVMCVPMILMAFRIGSARVTAMRSRGNTQSQAVKAMQNCSIVLQIAFAAILLNSSLLLAISFSKITDVAPGFQPAHALSGFVSLPRALFNDGPTRLSAAERIDQRLKAVQGVGQVGLATALPMFDGGPTAGVWVDDARPEIASKIKTHYRYQVYGSYFKALEIPLLSGRYLTADDSRRSDLVCVVDAAFANQYWPQGGALGHSISDDPTGKSKKFTIIGIVGSVKQTDLTAKEDRGTIYLPFLADSCPSQFIVVARTAVSPSALASIINHEVSAAVAGVPLDNVRTMEQRLDDTLLTRRVGTILIVLFSIAALLVNAVGIYGVVSYTVINRWKEIGIKMALGATQHDIFKEFLFFARNLLLIGLTLGLVSAVVTGRMMSAALFNVTPLSPVVLASTAAITMVVVVLASLTPARQATSMSPSSVLRND